MSTNPFPINDKPYYSTDGIANALNPNDMVDCYLEPAPELGFVTRRRPGLKKFTDVGTVAGDGIFWWDAKSWLIVVNAGKVYRVLENGTSTLLSGALLASRVPVIFADGQAMDGTPWLYMANGKLVYTLGTTVVEPTDANAPDATHVTFMKSVFLANQPGTNRFLFTDTNPSTGLLENNYWSSTDNPLTCEAKGDLLLSMISAWQELYCWGSQGLEIWQNDGVTPFIPVAGAFSEGGIEATYSVAAADNTVFALCVINGSRVVVKLSGRSPVVVSAPIATVLANMNKVSDAIGDLISVGGLTLYMLNFPSEDQTWVYDYKNDLWYRWGYFLDGAHQRFLGQHVCYAKAWNKHFVLSRLDGAVYEMRRDFFQDNEQKMISYRRTSWENHGTFNRKICDQFYVKCKSGTASPATLMVRWRDDGRSEWSNFMEMQLAPVGDRDFLSKNNRFGMYRSRQYEFRISDNADLVLVSVDTEMRGLSS